MRVISTVNNRVKIKSELLLPAPKHLVPRPRTGAADALCSQSALSDFIANELQDSEVIENWIVAQAPLIAGLPPLSTKEELTSKQHIYDRYFGVHRHGGSTASIALAVGQVMGELSRELQSGSGLGEQDVNHLLDGLAAVLEAANEC